MDPEVIANIVGSLGFPVVACGALFWFINKQEEHNKSEISAMRDAIVENTSVMTGLKELIQVLLNNKEK